MLFTDDFLFGFIGTLHFLCLSFLCLVSMTGFAVRHVYSMHFRISVKSGIKLFYLCTRTCVWMGYGAM